MDFSRSYILQKLNLTAYQHVKIHVDSQFTLSVQERAIAHRDKEFGKKGIEPEIETWRGISCHVI